jgi:acetylglutamate kinase
MNKDDIIVVKIGGDVLSNNTTIMEDMVDLSHRGERLLIVHGGGGIVTEWLGRQNISTSLINGERITDEETLEVAVAVLCGWVNKRLVSVLNWLWHERWMEEGRVVGISGIDGIIKGKPKDSQKGFMGEVVEVRPQLIYSLLDLGYLPIIAPGGVDKKMILNINGDSVASAIAYALKRQKLIFLTDAPGVLDKQGKIVPELSPQMAERLISEGVIAGGMIPKLRAGIHALTSTSVVRIIDGRTPHALIQEMEGKEGGTTIFR